MRIVDKSILDLSWAMDGTKKFLALQVVFWPERRHEKKQIRIRDVNKLNWNQLQ